MTHLAIEDVAEYSATSAKIHQHWFEVTGGWATDERAETEPQAQQRFAVATHRHAWHAELWERRRPAIPVDVAPVSVPAGATLGRDTPVEHRLEAYCAALDVVLAADAALRSRCDERLDPSTLRVIELVTADLVRLRQRDG